MSQIANIVAFDGANTPVSHTFYPESVAKPNPLSNEAIWKEALGAVPDYAQGKLTLTKRKLASGTTRVSLRVEIPVMESVSGQNASGYTAAPKVAYVDTVEFVQYVSPRSTASGRKLIRQLALNVMGNIATSVAAATAGPMPEAFDSLLNPT